MRKNTAAVMSAFVEGKALYKCDAVWTNGTVIYSYAEPIVAPNPDNPDEYVVVGEPLMIPGTGKVSQTTTQHVNSLAFGLSHDYGKVVKRVPAATVQAARDRANYARALD